MIKPGWVDIVDEADMVVGQVERTPAWDATRHTPHRCIQVYGLTADGAIILAKRALTVSFMPGALDALVGGLPHAGETYDACAQRKLQAELGLNAPLTALTKLRDDETMTGQFAGFCQLYTVAIAPAVIQLNPANSSGLVTVSPTTLETWLTDATIVMTSATRHALAALAARG